jgi:uncharacterized protein (DUF58 family)
MLLVLSLAGLGWGLVSDAMGMLTLSLAGLILLAIARFLSRINLNAIHYHRELPSLVCQMEPFALEAQLENGKRRFHSFDIVARDHAVHDNAGGEIHFGSVGASQAETVRVPVELRRRGTLGPFCCQLGSAFPLGLVKNQREQQLAGTVIVYPMPRLPPEVRDLLENDIGSGGYRRFPSNDVTGDFRALRDYREGDRFKLISWPVSLRLQRLIVREMETSVPQDIMILHHTYHPPNARFQSWSFERSLQILSGLFHYFRGNFTSFSFVAAFNDWRRLRVGIGDESFREALISLAMAKMRITGSLDEIRDRINEHGRGNTALLVVSNTPAEHWRDALREQAAPALVIDNRAASAWSAERVLFP